MSTIPEILTEASSLLTHVGVPNPRVDAEWLLAHVLQARRDRLWTAGERAVTEAQRAQFQHLVDRRRTREPLQYILGTQEFYGRTFCVTPDVLIPRPETELVVEVAIHVIASIANQQREAIPRGIAGTRDIQLSILDLCTGSGCIAVTLAAEYPTARTTAMDISPTALAIARRNAAWHQVEHHIAFTQGDVTGDWRLPSADRFDCIIANPPYCPTPDLPGLQPEVRDYEPRIALDAGEDGLAFLRAIIKDAPVFLQPGGWLMVEIGNAQAAPVKTLLHDTGRFHEPVGRNDYHDIERMVIAQLRSP